MTTIEISRHACPAAAGVCDISSEDASAEVHSRATRPARVRHRSSLGDNDSLAEMLTSAQRGDEHAFAQFYRHTSPLVFGAIRRVINHRAEAEDILHDVYMALWQGSLTFDAQRGGVLPWMLTIARNRAISYLRRQQHLPLDEARVSSIPSDAALPQDINEKKRELQRLAFALTTLSAQQRQAITIAYFGGFSFTELAQVLGVPEGTAKSWIRRGIARLRQVLEHGTGSRGSP